MGIESKSHENIESQNTGGLKSSSLEAQKKEVNTQQEANKLVKIHTFLESIDDDKEDKYKQTLLNLDKDSLNLLLKKPQTEILQLLQKTDNQLQSYLIQAQIDELKSRGFRNLSKEEKIKYGTLKKELITVAKSETKIENNEQTEIKKTNIKIAELRGVLLSNSKLADNSKIDKIREKFDEIAGTENQKEKQEILDSIIATLKEVGTLESIAKDLGGVNSKEYGDFKKRMIQVEPSLREDFDRVEMGGGSALPKMKLGTDDLKGTKLKDGVLSKTEDGVTTSFSDEDGRYLNSDGSDFKLKSELDPDNEEKLKEVNTQANEILEPINDSLNVVSGILDFIQKAKDTGANFDEIKEQIKSENPDIYGELGLENKNSFDDMLLVLSTKKQELEKEKEDIMKKAKFRINQLLERNVNEAEEKDKVKKQMIKFFDAIGLTKLIQTEFNKVVSQVNINPGNYDLDGPIDLENGDIGFNKDFGESSISSQEKLAFVKFFNRMLGKEIVKIDEKNQKIIPLDSTDINSLQKVANKKSGFFMENFNKEKK